MNLIAFQSAIDRASHRHHGSMIPAVCLLLASLLFTGCGRDEIHTYQVPKEDGWKLPIGWSERPAGAMRSARFGASGREGREIDISLIPLKGMPGTKADVINIWRSQLKLEPLSEDALAKSSERVPVGPDQADLYDMISTEPATSGTSKSRSLLATLKRDDVSWFIKMSGEEGDVGAQKTNFLSFLKSLNLAVVSTATEQPRRQSEDENTTAPPPSKPEWSIPPSWQETSPGQMLRAKFLITEGEARADVNISALGGDGGGLRGNVNRWRGQLGLSPVEESDLSKLVTSLDLPEGKAILIEMNGTNSLTGKPASFVAVIVPRSDETWFYRLMGDEKIVAREKDALKKFVQSVKYPNG